jgi:competence protein ComFB
MELKNHMETLVLQKVDELLVKNADVCSCSRCRLDIAAIALNNLPPKYYVTEKGELFHKTAILNRQFEPDIIRAVLQGINKVAASPNHN